MNDKQEMDMIRDPDADKNIICCIGVDGKKHRCVAWEKKCLCGVKILHKNPSPELESKYMFSCYECTY